MKKFFFTLFAFCLLSISVSAQNGTVILSGYVRDAGSGEAIIGATVYTSDKKAGTGTNSFGFYSLTVPSESKVICSCIGYSDVSLDVSLSSGSLKHDFELSEDKQVLKSAKVFSRSKKDMLHLPQMGVQTLDALTLKKLPALLGEQDIIRVIQMMPGVQSPSEGSTGFSVRGGGIDQNLILMDGAPVYNSGHFLGFLSMFNGDIIKNAQLYKGDFPAIYGGKTSSVLDVSTIDGNMNSFGGEASIGILTSKIFLNGPIVKNKLSFALSARRSYMDLFFPLFNAIPEGTKLSFYDVNAKLSWNINDSNRLYLSVFSSDDLLGMSLEDLGVHSMKFDYKNNTQSLRWSHVFGPRLTSNLTLYHSAYLGSLDCNMDDCCFVWHKKLRELGLRNNYTWHIDANNTMEFGLEAAYYHLNPSSTYPYGESLVNQVLSPSTNAVSPALYIQNEQKIDRLTLRYGLRFSSFSTMGETEQLYYDPQTHQRTDSVHFGPGEHIKTYFGLDPRLSASFKLSDNMSLKASYARSHQYIGQTSASSAGGVLDVWFAASPNVKPEISDQWSVGVNRNFLDDAIEVSAETFYKANQNTRDLKDNPGLIIIDSDREGALRFGSSWAYGVELMAKYEFNRLNGWVGYTWSRSMYKIDGINDGNPYRSPINHEHAVNIVSTFELSKQVSLSATWVFYSGAPLTLPVARFKYAGTYIPIYNSRNEDSMPDYHRADLSLTVRSKKRVEGKRWSGEWNFSIYNLYDRHNAWSISTGYNSKEDQMDARLVYLFPIIPSISYNLKF